ncbi:MAG: intradiol ring-cleavage dioxygenase [Ignavibacteriales bacterium]|nr:MAG: intradiol ring-cleavage dioxygenase [Ignavibacteriales bacterium]
MKHSYQIGFLLFLCSFVVSCNGQTNQNSHSGKTVGGAFENSEFTYYGIPKSISAVDTSPAWNHGGQKILLTGVVYQRDGKTPAPDVLLYYYQTNTEGRYLHKPEESRSMTPNNLGQTHGYIRGWVKTDADGKYSIYTTRPGAYPAADEPAHIHLTVKEPNDINEYYIDDYVFDDDPLLTTARRKRLENRCGSGVLRFVQQGELQVGERNIILGLNIPDYPVKHETGYQSGIQVGEDIFSFIPYHAWGPDKGTRTCPVCKYGWYHGILYFVGDNPDWNEIRQWLIFLENESSKRGKYLKVYFIYGNEKDYSKSRREEELSEIGRELKIKHVALTYVPSFTDSESEVDLNKINPQAENTFFLFKRSRLIEKFVNLKPGDQNFERITAQLDASKNEYFDAEKPKQN